MVIEAIHDLTSDHLHDAHHGTHGFACESAHPGATSFTTAESHGATHVEALEQSAAKKWRGTRDAHKKPHTGNWRLHPNTNSKTFMDKLKGIISGHGHGHVTAQQVLAARDLHAEMSNSGPNV